MYYSCSIIKKITTVFAVAASVVFLSSCSESNVKRPALPECTSMGAVEPFTGYSGSEKTKIDSGFTLKYSDYNYAESDLSQSGILVGRCIRILSYAKSDAGTLQLAVKNESDEDIKYAVLTCTANGEQRSFKISVLPKYAECILTEDNGAVFDENQSCYDFELKDKIVFDEKMSVYPDVFSLRAMDGVISVKNISDKPVSNVYVYYKTEENGVFVGNETYRVKFSNFTPGEEKELNAEHYKAYTGKIVFIEYDN